MSSKWWFIIFGYQFKWQSSANIIIWVKHECLFYSKRPIFVFDDDHTRHLYILLVFLVFSSFFMWSRHLTILNGNKLSKFLFFSFHFLLFLLLSVQWSSTECLKLPMRSVLHDKFHDKQLKTFQSGNSETISRKCIYKSKIFS